MLNNNYSSLSKFLHEFYLGNYFISETSFEIEKMLHGKILKQTQLGEIVFITGLARAGTTALFHRLYETNAFATLKYSNMPLLLMPNLWKNFNKTSSGDMKERAHKDGIKINVDSPEEFDEYFWKVFLKDAYISKDHLSPHEVSEKTMREYVQYLKLVAHSYGKKNYLSKNNNNILRLASLLQWLPNPKIILLFRKPLEHAKSLMKQHENFVQLQTQDSFALKYFNYLGHHEFGLGHKPFHFTEGGYERLKQYKTDDLNYWLLIWKNYYQYLLDIYDARILLISFEDLCAQPSAIANFLNSQISLESPVEMVEAFRPPTHAENKFDERILEECEGLYAQLNAKRAYQC
jgi:hypothetical protein